MSHLEGSKSAERTRPRPEPLVMEDELGVVENKFPVQATQIDEDYYQGKQRKSTASKFGHRFSLPS